jgi:hypothetical protein
MSRTNRHSRYEGSVGLELRIGMGHSSRLPHCEFNLSFIRYIHSLLFQSHIQWKWSWLTGSRFGLNHSVLFYLLYFIVTSLVFLCCILEISSHRHDLKFVLVCRRQLMHLQQYLACHNRLQLQITLVSCNLLTM